MLFGSRLRTNPSEDSPVLLEGISMNIRRNLRIMGPIHRGCGISFYWSAQCRSVIVVFPIISLVCIEIHTCECLLSYKRHCIRIARCRVYSWNQITYSSGPHLRPCSIFDFGRKPANLAPPKLFGATRLPLH